jgi:SAM-dependent methyltransferase
MWNRSDEPSRSIKDEGCGCELVAGWSLEMMPRSNMQPFFDSNAENASWEFQPAEPPSTAELEFLDDDMKKWIPDYPSVFRDRMVLDLGAGRGLLGIIVAERYSPKLCISLDLGFHRLRAATGWVATLPNFSLICADVFRLPFPNQSFDLVVANSLLHHFPNLDAATEEIARILRPGGFYIGREPNFDNPVVRAHIFKLDGTWWRRYARVTPNEYPLRARQIRASFSRSGCSCDFRYFWRRFRYLRHPILSVAVSVRAQKLAPSFI